MRNLGREEFFPVFRIIGNHRKWAYNDGTLFEFFRAIGPTG